MISLRSKTTQKALGFLFLHKDETFYVNELARQIGADSGNLTRKLLEMEKEGLLKSEQRGNQKHYALNKNYSLLDEYEKIINKTVGLEAELTAAMKDLKGVEKAWIFGSYATNKMDTASDIDLLIVGSHSPLEAQKACLPIQKKIRREINLVSLTPREYSEKEKNESFIRSILKKPKIALI